MFNFYQYVGKFQMQWKQVSTSATPQLLIPPDATRPILYIQNNTSSPMLIVQDPIPPPSSAGQFQIASLEIIAFTWLLDGPMSTQGWYVWTPAGAGILSFTEVRWIAN